MRLVRGCTERRSCSGIWIATVVTICSAQLCFGAPPSGPNNRDLEQAVLDIIKQHPEVIVEALNRYRDERIQARVTSEWRKYRENPLILDLRSAPAKGPANAPLKIVEIADFQCPLCAAEQPVLESFMKEHRGQVCLYFLHLPISYHAFSKEAAEAAWAADQQGKFFDFERQLFALNANLNPGSFDRIAKGLKLNLARFDQDRGSQAAAERITQDAAQAKQAGILGTPSFVMNGVPIRGAAPLSELDALASLLGFTPPK